jgi:cell division protein FtsB
MESSESEVETLKLENSVLKKEIETLREYLKQLLDAIQEM